MSTLTKLALGVMGQLRPRPARGDARATIKLPAPDKRGGLPLMQALAKRRSSREFQAKPLPLPVLSSLLWAAFGVNRRGGGRTAPSAINAQEIDVYVALPGGAYLYDARAHTLRLVASSDLRRITGYQDFVDDAPLDLVYVADFSRVRLVPASQREAYACVAAGAITQNVYLYAAANKSSGRAIQRVPGPPYDPHMVAFGAALGARDPTKETLNLAKSIQDPPRVLSLVPWGEVGLLIALFGIMFGVMRYYVSDTREQLATLRERAVASTWAQGMTDAQLKQEPQALEKEMAPLKAFVTRELYFSRGLDSLAQMLPRDMARAHERG